MISTNAKAIQASFTRQAENFETKAMSFSKQEYLEHTVSCANPKKTDTVLEVAAGTCVCGRSLAPFVQTVTCLDMTAAMLAVGKDMAEKEGFCNMNFVQGDAERLPFLDDGFDIVISRLAFHHFANPKRCFSEMARVLKPGGKLVVIDMEAAEEALRATEDEIETMRDPSHMRNLSRNDFAGLFENYHLTITAADCTEIPVSLTAWLALTQTCEGVAAKITQRLRDEMAGGSLTGLQPYEKDGKIYFNQRWLMMIGEKSSLPRRLKDGIAKYAEDFDSFYLYDESGIHAHMESLKSNFPNVDFLYSIKCNSNPHVLRSIFAAGFGADAASMGEVLLAEKAGLTKEDIFYSAPGKSREDIEAAVSRAVLIADSIDEIKRIEAAAERLGENVEIGIRLNPDFSFDGNAGRPSKFGIDEEQAIAFLKGSDLCRIKITGIHVHLKSQELEADVLASYYSKVLRLAEKFENLCGGLKYVNMGSGMGISYSPQDTPLDVMRLAAAVESRLNTFRTRYPDTKIIIETGRYVVGKSGFYVTKVTDRKTSYGRTYLILKNTLNGFLRPSLAKLVAHYSGEASPDGSEPLFTSTDAFEFLTLKEDARLETVTLTGNLCTASDVVAEDLQMPHLVCGDSVIITNAGSYGAVLSPMQFSSQEKPIELFLNKNG